MVVSSGCCSSFQEKLTLVQLAQTALLNALSSGDTVNKRFLSECIAGGLSGLKTSTVLDTDVRAFIQQQLSAIASESTSPVEKVCLEASGSRSDAMSFQSYSALVLGDLSRFNDLSSISELASALLTLSKGDHG